MPVSVVVPIYQRQQDGEKALRSVLGQTGVEFEVILIDDGSPTPFILPIELCTDRRFRLVRQDRNAGAGSARNRGIREARHEWIAFLDSDDLWRPGKLAAQLEFAEAQCTNGMPTLFAAMTGFRQTDGSGRSVDRVPIGAHRPEDLAAGCWFSPGSTALLPRSAFSEVGLYDETLERLEDLDWFLRFALAGGAIRTLGRILVDVRVGGRPSLEKLDRSIARLKSKWLSASSPLTNEARVRLEAYLLMERAAAHLGGGNWQGFAGSLAKSLWLVPRRRIHLENWWQ